MSLQYIIDGYNLIHHPAFRRLSRKSSINPRFAFLELIKDKRLTGSPKNRVIVVFDGFANQEDNLRAGERANLFSVVFSQEETADERIKKMLEKSTDPKNTIVVSDDKEISFFARMAKAIPMSAQDFLCAKEKGSTGKEAAKEELSYTQIDKIDQELRRIWLE